MVPQMLCKRIERKWKYKFSSRPTWKDADLAKVASHAYTTSISSDTTKIPHHTHLILHIPHVWHPLRPSPQLRLYVLVTNPGNSFSHTCSSTWKVTELTKQDPHQGTWLYRSGRHDANRPEEMWPSAMRILFQWRDGGLTLQKCSSKVDSGEQLDESR